MFTGLLFPRLVNVVIFNVCCVHLISWGCLPWHTLTQHLFHWAAAIGILQISYALLHYLLLPISFESTINSSNATLALCSLFISITLVIYFVFLLHHVSAAHFIWAALFPDFLLCLFHCNAFISTPVLWCIL